MASGFLGLEFSDADLIGNNPGLVKLSTNLTWTQLRTLWGFITSQSSKLEKELVNARIREIDQEINALEDQLLEEDDTSASESIKRNPFAALTESILRDGLLLTKMKKLTDQRDILQNLIRDARLSDVDVKRKE